MNFYKRYMGDYLRDTLDLSMTEDGAYNRLLDWCYANERPIPHEDRYRVGRAQSANERKAVDKVLARFFSNADDAWVSKRVNTELEAAGRAIDAARQNGRRGGRPKGTKHKPNGLSAENPVGSELVTQTEPREKAHQKPETKSQRKIPPYPPKTDEEPNGFPKTEPDRLLGMTAGVAKREDVQRVHAEWLRVFRMPPNTPLVVGWNTEDAERIAAAIDAHSEPDCVAMLRHAPSDGMVSGREDERGAKHESIRYLFGTNLPRLIRDAKAAQQTHVRGKASSAEIERRKREE